MLITSQITYQEGVAEVEAGGGAEGSSEGTFEAELMVATGVDGEVEGDIKVKTGRRVKHIWVTDGD